jgi:outer membrane biosynthesis protein TonB
VDEKGRVVKKDIERTSGSPKVDRILLHALSGALEGFPPPKEALENGVVEVVLVLEKDYIKIGIR